MRHSAKMTTLLNRQYTSFAHDPCAELSLRGGSNGICANAISTNDAPLHLVLTSAGQMALAMRDKTTRGKTLHGTLYDLTQKQSIDCHTA